MPAELCFQAMGSEAHLIIDGDPGLLHQARRRIETLEGLWSRFRDDSEISMLNRGRGRPHRVSAETLHLVRIAVQGWRATAGRFDPTVLGDMIRSGYDRPFQSVVRNQRGGVSLLSRNCAGIVVDGDSSTVCLPSNAGFDPGGIGKGLAADIVAEEILAAGAGGVCVNIGGDLRAEGIGPYDGRWIIDVEQPGVGGRAKVALKAGAVATSSTASRSWMVDGQIRNHLIGPGMGLPLRSSSVSATAVAREASLAEVATKAALLADQGFEVDAIQDLGCEGRVIDKDGVSHKSANLDRFLVTIDTSNLEAGGAR